MKRIAFFTHWNSENIIDDYEIEYLIGLREVVIEIVFISNSIISEVEQLKVTSIVNKIIIRENIGLDFGAWKDAILQLSCDYLKEFDQLILANNSCYGPIFPLSEMFDIMDKKGCDFWGITKNLSKTFDSICIPEHIQSYFMVFNQAVFLSNTFLSFFKNLDFNKNEYNKVVLNAETQLTDILNKVGFTYNVFLNYSEVLSKKEQVYYLDNDLGNLTIWASDKLLLKRNPLLKRKALIYFIENFWYLMLIGYGNQITPNLFSIMLFWPEILDKCNSIYDKNNILQDLSNSHAKKYTIILQNRSIVKILFSLLFPVRWVLFNIHKLIKSLR